MRDFDRRPLMGALVLSTALHAFLLFAHRIHFDSPDWGRQVVILQATLRALPDAASTPPHAASAPPERAPAPKRRESPAVPGKAGDVAPEEAGAQRREPEKPPEPERRERAAVALSDPGAPEYPDDAVARKLESCVLAAVLVSAAGDVESVRILHADVPAVFDRSVIDAYSRARYLPAQRNGEAVPSRVLAVASFVLTPDRPRNCAGRYAPAARRINGMPVSAGIDPALVESMLHAGR